MKKLFTLIACALCAVTVMAQDYFPVKITVAAAGTSAYADVDLSQTFGKKCLAIDHVSAVATSGGGTGVVTFASFDHAVETTLATSSSLSVAAGGVYLGSPARSTSTLTTLQNIVVTNNIPLLVASTNTVYATEPYIAKTVRVKVTQLANPVATVYNAVIFTK